MGFLKRLHDRLFGDPAPKAPSSRFVVENVHRQEFSFFLGQEYKGKATLQALASIEEYMDCSIMDLGHKAYTETLSIDEMINILSFFCKDIRTNLERDFENGKFSYLELVQIYQLVILFVCSPNEVTELLKKK